MHIKIQLLGNHTWCLKPTTKGWTPSRLRNLLIEQALKDEIGPLLEALFRYIDQLSFLETQYVGRRAQCLKSTVQMFLFENLLHDRFFATVDEHPLLTLDIYYLL